MKKSFLLISTLISLLAMSCKKTDSNKGNGWVVFSTPSNANGTINVTINGNTSKVGIVLSNPDFDCNTYKGYNGTYLLDVGTYNYTAIADNGKTWSGSFEILTDDDCVKRRLQ